MSDGFTRRRFLYGAGGLALLGAAGCGGSSSSGGSAGSGETRNVEHKYGTTEISGTPQRVVSIGYSDQDPVLALGVVPVGVREWFGEYPGAIWPWAEEALGRGDLPEVLSGTEALNFEQIAALEPDLILGLYSGLTQEEYDTLSQIAPTVAQSGEYADYGTPWQEMTRVTGRALNRQARAERLVSDLEARFSTAQEDNPQLEGASGLVVGANSDGGSYTPSPYTLQDTRGQFLQSLGLKQPEELRDELSEDAFFVNLSRERLDLLDGTDVLIWVEGAGVGFEPVMDDPLYEKLAVAREERDLFLEDKILNGALSFGTVLSLPLVLDELVPRIAEVVGDSGA